MIYTDEKLGSEEIRRLVKQTPMSTLPLAPIASLLPRAQVNWQVVRVDQVQIEAQSSLSQEASRQAAVKCIDNAPTFLWSSNLADLEADDNLVAELDLPPLAKVVLENLPSEGLPKESTGNSVTQKELSNVSVKMRWAAPQELARSTSKLYLHKVEQFLSETTIGRLVDINRSLNHVDADAIDLKSAELVVDAALQFLQGDLSMCLAVCETVLQYRLKRPDALRLNSIKTINSVIAAFKAIVLEIPSTLEAFVGVEWVMDFWVRLINDKGLDDQQCLGLLLAAYSVIFSPNFQSRTMSSKKYDGINVLEQARRKCADLVFACYSAFPGMRKEIVHDLLDNLTKLGKWRRGFSISFAPGSGSVHVVTGLILRMIQKSGETPMSVWHEAAETKSKAALEKACQAALNEARNVCVTISQYLIEACHTGAKTSPIRVLTQCLMEDMAATLPFAEWPASELFISCFVSVLFHASPTYMKQRSFMIFLLDMLKTVEHALFDIYKSSSDISMIGTIMDQLMRLRKPHVANFLATTLRARCNKSVSFLECYARMTAESPPYVGCRRIPESQWFKVLKNWQIGSYYEQIMEVMLTITCDGNAADKSQVEILKLLAQCVDTNSRFFGRIKEKLLASILEASPSVCDGSMLVITRYIAATSIDASEDLISRAVLRMSSPGLASYKKRCARFLAEVFVQTEKESLQILAWKSLLRVSSDSELTVSKLGTELLQDLVFNTTLDRAKHLETLSAMVLKSHTSEPPYPWLLRRFLRLTLMILPSQKVKRENIRDLVGFLLASIGDGGRPDFSALQAASVVLEANGFYVPNSKIAALFSLSCSNREDAHRRLLALRMLNSAVNATPRMIISPRVISHFFPLMLSKLQLYTEPEIEYAAPILWALCKFGNISDRKKRTEALEKLTENAIAKYRSERSQTDSVVLLSKLILLMTASVRYWVESGDVHPQRDLVTDHILHVIQKRGGKLRLAAVVCLMKICTRYPNMFLNSTIDRILHEEVLVQPSSEEWNIFIMLLLEFLQGEEDRIEVKKQGASNLMSDNILHSNAEEAVVDSASAGLLQRYLEPILQRALASEDAFAAVSARLLVQAIESGRVSVHESLPAVIALTTAQELEISKAAQRGYTFITSRWGSMVEQKLSEGIQLAVEYHLRCQTAPIAPKQIAWLWEELRARQSTVRAGIQRLIQSFKSCKTEYAVAVISGLTAARIEERDVRILVNAIEDVCYACDLSDPGYSGESIAVMIALYGFRLLLLSNLSESAEVHTLDASRIISRYANDAEFGRSTLEQLFDIDHLGMETESLLYGSKRRRL